MKNKISVLLSVLCTVLFSSCADYLDKLPDGDMTLEDAFSNYVFADQFLANAYFHLPNETWVANTGAAYRSPYTGGCDELEVTFGDSYSHYINAGSWNPSNIELVPVWSESYMGLRKINIYLENLDKVPIVPNFTESKREQRRGEAYFLRAILNFHLLRCFGPFVILPESLPTDVNTSDFKRNTFSDCVEFILEDCKRAEELLPLQYTEVGEFGRGTAAAALALKSRLLLYAASPLFNGNPDYADFTDHDGEHLFPRTENPGLWADAATAALDAITKLSSAGYALYEGQNEPALNFFMLFHDHYNPEWIFWRNIEYDVHGLDRCSNPLSVAGFSILSVTQEMVDAYQMANGVTPITGYNADGSPIINPASGYVEAGYTATVSPEGRWPAGVRNMYVNREPRFYASVNFAGQIWKTSNCELWNDGVDGKGGAASDYSKTGYLLKKYANPYINFWNYEGNYQNHSHYFRFGELYLNYAEAINEAEGPTKAYPYINRIRNRAGLPDLPDNLNQAEMREAVRHERRIELAFENHRFFDVRRWKIAPDTDNKPIHGLDIYAGTHLQDDTFYVRTEIEPRVFEKQHYLWPIPQAEINRTERLIVQNPWWSSVD